MYVNEGTPNQSHQGNIDFLHEPSDIDFFFINSTIRPLHTNTAPKPPAKTIGLVPTDIPLQPLLLNPPPLQTNFFNRGFTGCQIIAENTTDWSHPKMSTSLSFSGIDGNYPFSVTTASGVITITPFWGQIFGNFA